MLPDNNETKVINKLINSYKKGGKRNSINSNENENNIYNFDSPISTPRQNPVTPRHI